MDIFPLPVRSEAVAAHGGGRRPPPPGRQWKWPAPHSTPVLPWVAEGNPGVLLSVAWCSDSSFVFRKDVGKVPSSAGYWFFPVGGGCFLETRTVEV